MKIFYDWEFYDTPAQTWPISLGMVADDGREFYAVVDAPSTLDLAVQDPWLQQYVFPSLPVRVKRTASLRLDENLPGGGEMGAFRWGWEWDEGHLDIGCVKTISEIRADVASFIIKSQPDPQLWAWFGAYDHVLLAKLFGRMADYPAGFPMWTNDLQQEAVRQNVRLPDQPAGNHNALADARHNLVRGAFLGLS